LAGYYLHRHRNEATPQQRKNKNMNMKVLLLGAVVTAFAFTSFATEPLLSPRAAGNQITRSANYVETQDLTMTRIAAGAPLLSPRAAGNQIKVAAGAYNDTNPVLLCQKTMIGSPRAVTECSSHTTMPGCMAVAPLK
jgi:hypothetical protein